MTPPPPGARVRASGGTEPPLVLVVDDNEKNLKLARDVLRADGLRTLEARSGAEGLALALSHLPDVVLLDLRLPDLDGTEVVRRLRNERRTATLPVVALSALPRGSDEEWLLSSGFTGCLEKPIRVSEFPAQVRRYCAMPGA